MITSKNLNPFITKRKVFNWVTSQIEIYSRQVTNKSLLLEDLNLRTKILHIKTGEVHKALTLSQENLKTFKPLLVSKTSNTMVTNKESIKQIILLKFQK